MRVSTKPKPIIDRAVLARLGDERLADAQALTKAQRYSAAIYLAGYAVECWLKVAICTRLEWDQLYSTFKVHDLDVLLLHSGLRERITQAPDVNDSFKRIIGVWKMEGEDNIRYKDPTSLTQENVQAFLAWVEDPETGVIPWVKAQM